MPTRYIKESCRTSKNLQALSDFSERLFWRLLTTADDYGRCLACPEIIRAACFPLNSKLPLTQINKALSDLQTNHLISVYTVGDRHYAEFVTFSLHQGQPRAKTSKYPDKSSSANICTQMPAIAPDLGDGPDTDTDTDTDTNTDLSSLSSSESEFEQFWDCYPKKVGKLAALKGWKRAKDRPQIGLILEAIASLMRSEQWTKDKCQYIPNPSLIQVEGFGIY